MRMPVPGIRLVVCDELHVLQRYAGAVGERHAVAGVLIAALVVKGKNSPAAAGA